ncbi:MAG: DUF5719 family protein [Marmoricola sp.]
MEQRSGGSRRLVRNPDRSSIQWQQASWRALALPLVLVALVVAMSLAAAGEQAPKNTEVTPGSEVTLSRTLSCVKDAGPSTASIGTVPAGSSGYTASPGQPGRVVFAPKAAASGYAAQWATGKGWLAARACPTPADDWWFVGAGAGISHRSVLTLDNPRSNDANVTIAAYGPKGQIEAPGLSGLLVPAGQSLRLDLETITPALGDLTVHVSAIRGLVAASMWEKWAQSPIAKPVSSWVPAAVAPSTRLQLIGIPNKLTHGTLLLTNPAATITTVKLKVVNSTATFAPTSHQLLTLPPESTYAVPIDDLIKRGVGAIQISSDNPITAALRSVRGNVEAYAAPALRIGAQATLGLPTRVPASLVLTAAAATRVEVMAIDAHGKVVLTKTMAIRANTTSTLALPATATALRLVGDRRSSASGAVILDKNGMAVLGLVPTATAATVPAVVAQPY